MPGDLGLEKRTMRKVILRLLPFLMVCYLFALVDRTNVGMASLQMNKDLGFSKAVFGFGASLFFYSYFLAEIPSNLLLEKVGARIWIARIMITWGLISAAMSLVKGVHSFYLGRFILGAAEAGFFPGVILYLTYWLPAAYRGRFMATFAVAIPAASFIGSPVSGLLLTMSGLGGLRGWQWLFLLEGVPAALLGVACLFVLTDRPSEARWLSADERAWLLGRLAEPGAPGNAGHGGSVWRLARDLRFWAMTLACVSASATGSVLGVWQPQLLKSFGLTNLETGLINSVPYGIAAILMVAWGLHSDRTGERRWHTAISLLMIALGVLTIFLTRSLAPTVALLSLVLIGAYSFKGPFWSLASGWLSGPRAAVGIAAINAISNLVGGGFMVNVYGYIHQTTGSYALALSPVALMAIASATILLILSRSQEAGQGAEALAERPSPARTR